MKLNQHKYEEYADALTNNIYFNDIGMDVKGTVNIPKAWILRIMNWSGPCTDPHETEDYYKNPRAMFVALDLIYRLLDSLDTHEERKE